jgi:hypothetical protein
MNPIKSFFVRRLCPELLRYKEDYNHLQKLRWKCEDELRLQKLQYSSVEKLLNLFNTLQREKYIEVINFVQCKNGEFHILAIVDWIRYKEDSKFLDIKLYNSNDGINAHPACWMKIKKYPESNKMEVQDITGGYKNIGLGSIAMNALIQYANNNNIKKIFGEISLVDWDHIGRLKHFYSKFDFEITLDEMNKQGKIVRHL